MNDVVWYEQRKKKLEERKKKEKKNSMKKRTISTKVQSLGDATTETGCKLKCTWRKRRRRHYHYVGQSDDAHSQWLALIHNFHSLHRSKNMRPYFQLSLLHFEIRCCYCAFTNRPIQSLSLEMWIDKMTPAKYWLNAEQQQQKQQKKTWQLQMEFNSSQNRENCSEGLNRELSNWNATNAKRTKRTKLSGSENLKFVLNFRWTFQCRCDCVVTIGYVINLFAWIEIYGGSFKRNAPIFHFDDTFCC